MHARRKISRTGGILPMGKISLTCSHAFFSLRREPGFNKEDHSFFRQAWFSSMCIDDLLGSRRTSSSRVPCNATSPPLKSLSQSYPWSIFTWMWVRPIIPTAKKNKHNTNNEIEKCLQDPTEHIPAHQAVTEVLTQSAAPYNFSHRFQIYPKDFQICSHFQCGAPFIFFLMSQIFQNVWQILKNTRPWSIWSPAKSTLPGRQTR